MIGAGTPAARAGDLYREHAAGLVRLAVLLVGDQATAQPSNTNPLPQAGTVLTGYDLRVNRAITIPVQVDGETGWGAAAW